MTQRGLVPRLRRPRSFWIDFPAVPSWAHIWQSALRASAPGQFWPCHFSLNLPQASQLLGMTKGWVPHRLGIHGRLANCDATLRLNMLPKWKRSRGVYPALIRCCQKFVELIPPSSMVLLEGRVSTVSDIEWCVLQGVGNDSAKFVVSIWEAPAALDWFLSGSRKRAR
jgi:hypothetical protein